MFLSKEKFTRRLQVLLLTATTAALTVVLHSIGVENNLYQTYWWFDVVTHMAGGITIGALIIILVSEKEWSTTHILLIALFPVIGWELFEIFFVSVAIKNVGYATETILDTLVGLLGVYSAILICRKA